MDILQDLCGASKPHALKGTTSPTERFELLDSQRDACQDLWVMWLGPLIGTFGFEKKRSGQLRALV